MARTLAQYELIELLGRGGMGEVHLARDTRLQRDVALKLLPEELADDDLRRRRFLREARAVAALSHPNITTVLEIGEQDERDFLVFEYVEGLGLDAMLGDGGLPLDELLRVASRLADAIAYAHEHGVIHRDLKPSNIMLDTRGEPKLLDFGLAKLLSDAGETHGGDDSTSVTITGLLIGTPTAMSPEQVRGEEITERSDVFSFGSLLYEMATGESPFLARTATATMERVRVATPPPLATVRPELPAAFVQVVETALEKRPEDRHASMATVRDTLTGLLADLRSGALAAPEPRPRFGLGWLAVIFAVLLVLMSLYAALDWFATKGGTGGG